MYHTSAHYFSKHTDEENNDQFAFEIQLCRTLEFWQQVAFGITISNIPFPVYAKDQVVKNGEGLLDWVELRSHFKKKKRKKKIVEISV
jgi:hypothetical protein